MTLRSFHPNSDFGLSGLKFYGDDRPFTLDDGVTSRVGQRFFVDPRTGEAYGNYPYSDPSRNLLGAYSYYDSPSRAPIGMLTSRLQFSNESGTVTSIDTSYSGKNAGIPFSEGSYGFIPVPSLDVHSSFVVTRNTEAGTLDITSQIRGDGFPNAEAFVRDSNGQKVFLGTFVREGTAIGSLIGDDKVPMIQGRIGIAIDKQGSFAGTVFDHVTAKSFTIDEWNRLHATKNPNQGRWLGQ